MPFYSSFREQKEKKELNKLKELIYGEESRKRIIIIKRKKKYDFFLTCKYVFEKNIVSY